MKYLIFILLSSFLFGQEFDCPSKKGILLSVDEKAFHCYGTGCHHEYEKIIISKKSDVLAVEGGKVFSILNEKQNNTILIKNDNHFLSYSFINNSLVKVGDFIKKGDVIGNSSKAQFNDFRDNNKYKKYYILMFLYWNENKNNTRNISLKCEEKFTNDVLRIY